VKFQEFFEVTNSNYVASGLEVSRASLVYLDTRVIGSLKQITGLCVPRGLKIDKTMDSTLHFVTAKKHDENVNDAALNPKFVGKRIPQQTKSDHPMPIIE